jgi:hypothetical protein
METAFASPTATSPPARERGRPSPNPRALCIQRLRTWTNSTGQIEHKHVAAIVRTAGSADRTTSSCTEVIAGTRRDDNEERGDERGWLRLAPATESTAPSALRQLPF